MFLCIFCYTREAVATSAAVAVRCRNRRCAIFDNIFLNSCVRPLENATFKRFFPDSCVFPPSSKLFEMNLAQQVDFTLQCAIKQKNTSKMAFFQSPAQEWQKNTSKMAFPFHKKPPGSIDTSGSFRLFSR